MQIAERVPGFLSAAEVQRFEERLREKRGLFTRTRGRGGLGPRYEVIDGEQIRRDLPEVAELGETRVRPVLEALSGMSVSLLGSPRRCMRVQAYTDLDDGFRWHLDAHDFAAMVTLRNTARGETQLIPETLSRGLKYLLYPLYPVPRVFSAFPRRALTMEAGDLLILRGCRVLHRGVTRQPGERVLLFFAFDRAGKRPNPVRDRIARWLNY